MNLHRIDHVSLNVGDRERSLAWYAEVLGLPTPRGGTAADQPVFLGAPDARLGLFADRAPGLRHIALATDAAGQEAVAARLDRLGVAHRAERHADHASLYFRDPDHIVIEVMVALGR